MPAINALTDQQVFEIKVARGGAESVARDVLQVRDQVGPLPHLLEGDAADAWTALNTAQALMTRAARLLHAFLEGDTPPQVTSESIAQIELDAGFTQEAGEKADG